MTPLNPEPVTLSAGTHGALGSHGGMVMTHPGLPMGWVVAVGAGIALIAIWAVLTASPVSRPGRHVNLARVPVVGAAMRFMTASPWPLVALKVLFAAAFLAVIYAGLFGTPTAELNLATMLTWNGWWILVIISVFFLGTAWCSVCPWNSLAEWLVKRRLWRRGSGISGLGLRVPRPLRRVWPALVLFVGFTWLELGLGVTTDPVSTALLAVLMVVLAASSLAVYERKAFCRYYCPVGRTIGCYSQLAPIEIRPVDDDVCARCTTLECYHGTETVEPCPTHLTMGRFAQNTYCTSCGACFFSCPYANVSWRLRSVAAEAGVGARPHWDEAWFMLVLWAVTTFHGLTMKIYWEDWMQALGGVIGDSKHLIATFTLGLAASIAIPILIYVLFVALSRNLSASPVPFRRWFSVLAFSVLPVAFAYHLSHNLSHLARESSTIIPVLANPLGTGAMAMKPLEMYMLHMDPLIPESLLHALQAGLLVWGFWVAVQILRHRGRGLLGEDGDLAGWRLVPMLLLLGGATAFNLVLTTQEMVMRM